jgi:hypothetical protein
VTAPLIIDEAGLERACIRALQARGETCPASEAALAVIGWMYMDLERATDALFAVVAGQSEEGRVPAAKGGDGVPLPLLASAFRMIYHAARGRQRGLEPRLAELVGPLDRFHRFLAGRDLHRLCRSAPEDDRVVAGHAVVDAGVNALLVQAESDLADVAIHTGFPTRAIIARRTRRAQALAERLWQPEEGRFVSRDAQGAPTSRTAEALLPLWCGAAVRRQAREMVGRWLAPGNGGYWTPVPLASFDRAEPGFDPGQAGRGAVSPLLNWLLVRGLYRYGFEDQAGQLSQATLALASEHGLRQGYHALSGEGIGLEGSVVTAALVLDLLKTPFTYPRW